MDQKFILKQDKIETTKKSLGEKNIHVGFNVFSAENVCSLENQKFKIQVNQLIN